MKILCGGTVCPTWKSTCVRWIGYGKLPLRASLPWSVAWSSCLQLGPRPVLRLSLPRRKLPAALHELADVYRRSAYRRSATTARTIARPTDVRPTDVRHSLIASTLDRPMLGNQHECALQTEVMWRILLCSCRCVFVLVLCDVLPAVSWPCRGWKFWLKGWRSELQVPSAWPI